MGYSLAGVWDVSRHCHSAGWDVQLHRLSRRSFFQPAEMKSAAGQELAELRRRLRGFLVLSGLRMTRFYTAQGGFSCETSVLLMLPADDLVPRRDGWTLRRIRPLRSAVSAAISGVLRLPPATFSLRYGAWSTRLDWVLSHARLSAVLGRYRLAAIDLAASTGGDD